MDTERIKEFCNSNKLLKISLDFNITDQKGREQSFLFGFIERYNNGVVTTTARSYDDIVTSSIMGDNTYPNNNPDNKFQFFDEHVLEIEEQTFKR